jgi:hemoglobin
VDREELPSEVEEEVVEAVTDTQATMYERLGGGPVIRTIVDRLYAWIARDDELWIPYFQRVQLQTLKAHMVRLLTKVLDGPDSYSGRALKDAHAHLHITPEHYDRVADYVLASLLVAHAPRDILAAVEALLLELRPQIAEVEA